MNRRWTLRLIPLVLALAVIGYRFLTADSFTNPVTGERHRVGLDSREELHLGSQAFQQTLRSEAVVDSGPDVELVRRVVARLTAVVGAAGQTMEWDVAVIRSPQANAFCLPGGKIAVYTGILPVCAGEDRLAAVLGHEIAHATCRHGSQRLFQQQNTQLLLTGAAVSFSDLDYQSQRSVMAALGAGAQYGILLPFSRDHESEADHIGLIYMARAGYDPHAAISLWQRMEEIGGSRSPEFASTHPSHGTRIRQLEGWLPEALTIYEGTRSQ